MMTMENGQSIYASPRRKRLRRCIVACAGTILLLVGVSAVVQWWLNVNDFGLTVGKAGTPFHDFVLYDADKASLERLLQLNLTFSLRLGGEPVSADCAPFLVQLAKQNNLKRLSIDNSKLTRDELLQLRNEIGGCLLQQVPQHHYDSMDERSVPQSVTGLW